MKYYRSGTRMLFACGLVGILASYLCAQTPASRQATGASSPSALSNKPRSFEETFPTPLLQAIALKNGAGVRGILSRRATPVNVADGTDYNQNPILLASVQGELSIIKVLLDAGANIEARGQFGMTALMLATLKGNAQVVELLLARGAKVDTRADNGATALMTAARDGFRELVEMLVQHGADVNAATKQGFTPLMAAADDGAMVLLLLRSGAKTDLTNTEGKTAACLAAKQKQTKKAAALAASDVTATVPCTN